MSSNPEPGASWPPPPERQAPALDVPGDAAAEALHHGWRLLVLGLVCAPPVFLPLAVWQAVAAGKARPGAGTALLLATGGVAAFWLAAVLLAEYISR